MRGILQISTISRPTSTDHRSDSMPYWSPCVLPLGDRSFAQHVVEVMVEWGVTTLDIICDNNVTCTTFLQGIGDGSRFGCKIRHSRRKASETTAANPVDDILIKVLADASPDEIVLIAQGDCIPLLDTLPVSSCANGLRFVDAITERKTGWCLAPVGILRSGTAITERHAVSECVRCDSIYSTLNAQRKALQGEFAPLIPAPLLGKRLAAGVYVARGAVIDPSARLIGPCWISNGCRIGPKVRIGPNVVLGENCIVESGTSLQNVIALPQTYIGEGLECDEAILDGRMLVSARHNTVVYVPDSFLLSGW